MTDKDIETYIWFELVNSEKHNDFMNWLLANFDISQRERKYCHKQMLGVVFLMKKFKKLH